MNQRLIRFDIRLPKEDYVSEFWNQENRDRFLLRPETAWPLSVDPLVWPSVFYSTIFREASKLPYGNIEVDPLVDDGKYWLNLEQMKAFYARHKKANKEGIAIAIQLFSEKSLVEDIISYKEPDGIQCGITLGHTCPDKLPANSEFLGYDVADASWISGLTNCGYISEEKMDLSKVWAPRLNSFGLLSTLEDAAEFRRLCDDRVSEHAPFWVYGISRLSLV